MSDPSYGISTVDHQIPSHSLGLQWILSMTVQGTWQWFKYPEPYLQCFQGAIKSAAAMLFSFNIPISHQSYLYSKNPLQISQTTSNLSRHRRYDQTIHNACSKHLRGVGLNARIGGQWHITVARAFVSRALLFWARLDRREYREACLLNSLQSRPTWDETQWKANLHTPLATRDQGQQNCH